MNLQHLYKKWDYRCLVPDSHNDPRKWRSYDMHGFRSAANMESLGKVDTFKYDNNFNNWIDPKVFKAFVKQPEKMWKQTFGFPYVKRLTTNSGSFRCWRKCAKLVSVCVCDVHGIVQTHYPNFKFI
jgi:hypothetical protein